MERVLNQAEAYAGKRVPLDDIVAVVCSVFEIDENVLLAPGRKQMPSRIRGVIGLLVQERGGATLTAVAGRFGRDLSSISRNVAMVQKLIKEDQSFRRQYMEAKNHVTLQP
jgi:chromosomal replication initiation ATPase DnaA